MNVFFESLAEKILLYCTTYACLSRVMQIEINLILVCLRFLSDGSSIFDVCIPESRHLDRRKYGTSVLNPGAGFLRIFTVAFDMFC